MIGGLLTATDAPLVKQGGSEQYYSLILSNQDTGNSQQAFLSITPNNGAKASLDVPTLAASEVMVVDGICLAPGDALIGRAAVASKVNYALLNSPPAPFRIFAHTVDGALKTHAV